MTTSHKKTSWHNVLGSNDTFLTFVEQESRSVTGQKDRKPFAPTTHPAVDILHQYVLGWLEASAAQNIRDHLDVCHVCTLTVLSIMQEEEELNDRLSNGMENSHVDQPRPATFQQELLLNIATEFWEPQWAGQLATAGDIPPQEYHFMVEQGDIKLICSWGGQHGNEPAYVHLSWEANIATKSELWAVFADPKTRDILHEERLGTRLQGEETFTSGELHFDPSTQPWAISIVPREVQA